MFSCIIFLTGAKRRTQDFAQHLQHRSTDDGRVFKNQGINSRLVNNVCMFVPSVLVMHTVAVLNQYVFMHFCNFCVFTHKSYNYIYNSLYTYIYIYLFTHTHRSLSLSKYVNQNYGLRLYDSRTVASQKPL